MATDYTAKGTNLPSRPVGQKHGAVFSPYRYGKLLGRRPYERQARMRGGQAIRRGAIRGRVGYAAVPSLATVGSIRERVGLRGRLPTVLLAERQVTVFKPGRLPKEPCMRRLTLGVLYAACAIVGWWIGGMYATRGQLRIHEPPSAFGAWRAVLTCSGLEPKPGYGLDAVEWYSDDLLAKDRFHSMVGVWNPTGHDSHMIVLAPSAIDDSVTVEHELLHYLMQPGPLAEKHPILYFVVKCHLIEQPVVGG